MDIYLLLFFIDDTRRAPRNGENACFTLDWGKKAERMDTRGHAA